MALTIYHNPACSKSRQALELIRKQGIEPCIVAYLDEMPDAAVILRVARQLGMGVRELMRTDEPDYREDVAGLAGKSEQQLAEWLSRHPRVFQRPVVVDDERGRAIVGRPPEKVIEWMAA